MDNYNSLTEQLIQNGIIKNETSDKNTDELFGIELDEDMNNSPFVERPIEIPKALQKKSKRINQTDMEMLSEDSDENNVSNSFKTIKRFLKIKESLASKGSLGNIENFLFAFFPKLYKAKLVRDAMAKLKELNIDANKLLDKTIPYGESETRYQSLIKYLSYANEIQTKIKKKTF